MARIAVVGGGFVGVTTAVVFAERGHRVALVEALPLRVEALRRGDLPFFEEGLAHALREAVGRGTLSVHSTIDELHPCDFVFLCVGTPSAADGGADLSHLRKAAQEVASALARWRAPSVVVVKSTVPPGTTRGLLRELAGVGPHGVAFGLAMNPEFLREGVALADARGPDRVVVGVADELARTALGTLYETSPCPVLVMDLESAEMVKYASNAFLAAKVAFTNEVANLCERSGIDVDLVMRGVGLDPRIGPRFLQAGPGFGGSCFPKDIAAMRSFARERGVDMGILSAVAKNNDMQPLRALALAQEIVGSLHGRRVAILGLSFKGGTSDVRETRALPIYRGLVAAGAVVTCSDPVAGPPFEALVGEKLHLEPDTLRAIAGQDLVIVQGDWPSYRELRAKDVIERMRRPAIVDCRRILPRDELLAAGVAYRAIGVGSQKV